MTTDLKKLTLPLKTHYAKSGNLFAVQLGKPLRLPSIRNHLITTNRQNSETSTQNFVSLQKNKQNLKARTNTIQNFNYHHKKKGTEDLLPIIEKLPQSTQTIQRVKSQKNITMHPIEMIGAYRVGNVIGKGVYATVKLVKNWKGGVFAMKTYDKFDTYDNYKRKNVQNQIEILQALDHPSILKFIQSISTPNSVNIITELIQKKSLGQWLRNQNQKRANSQQLKTIMKNILEVLKYLSEKGISHRDLKLDNIMISRDLSIKLIDFGFSIKSNQMVSDFCGTPHYISPQIISRGGYFAEASDIWAAGILFYKLATGSFPFKGINDKILYRKICRGELQFPQYVDKKVQKIIQEMLELDYTQRPKAVQILKNNWFYQE